ncbi:MAG: hypothetical protein L6R42_003740, partial [Xanthoria sp. 1 TBL-2021]
MADPNMSNVSLSRKVEAEEIPSHHDGGPANLSLCQSATVGDTSKRSHEAHSNVNEPLETNEGIPNEQYEAEGVGGSAMDAVDDNISITSIEMLQMEKEEVQKEVQQILPSDSTFAKTRKIRDKFAKASGLYVQGLEARVRTLETQIRDIQVQTGLKKKEEDVGVSPSLDGPCSPFRALNPVHLTTRDLKNRSWHDTTKDGAACLVLGFTSGLDFLQGELLHPLGPHTSKNGNGGGPTMKPMERTQFRAAELARIMFISPWFLIVVQLLTGEECSSGLYDHWIYPFKYPLTYSEHIKVFVELLKEVEVDSMNVNDMLTTLTEVIRKVATSLGPKRDDVEISTENTAKICQSYEFFDGHSAKAKQSATAAPMNQGQEDASGNGTPTGQPISSGKADQPPRFKCTCLKDARDHLQSAIVNHKLEKIRFRDLWLLFKPGDLIITSQKPHLAHRVLHVRGGRPLLTKYHMDPKIAPSGMNTYEDPGRTAGISPFVIDSVRIAFDGAKFGPIHERTDISEFDDEKNIVELEVYPMGFSKNAKALRELLLTRGQRFAQLRSFKHKRYTGLSLTDPAEEIDSEVIVDFTSAFRQFHTWKPLLGIKDFVHPDCRELYEDGCVGKECFNLAHNRISDDTALDDFLSVAFINDETNGLLHQSAYDSQALSEDQLILLPYRVQGYSLRSRNWVPLNIDHLSDIENDDAPESASSDFDDLVIREEYKRAVKALVKSHSLSPGNRHQVDLVRGKGKGLIILLHGVPGVGKTSTAECVAAYTKRPLFPITCGDIGQTAPEVETNLEQIFLLARKWGCVLLLDEADVFLAKRERDSIDRNALVTVFLRALEYYSGILFLTTNRIGAFDEAFISRIHMSLYYPDLNQENTFKVWTMNLDRLKRSGRNIYIDNGSIKTFAGNHWKDGHRWNGRQIRNAFQTALALAEYDFHDKCRMCEEIGDKPPSKPVLLADHFKAVAETSAQFHDYLTDVLGGSTHKTKAKMGEVRSDSWQDRGVETPSGKKYNTERASRMKVPQNDRLGV